MCISWSASTSTGVAPARMMLLGSAAKAKEEHSTSSPGLTPIAIRLTANAAVPLETASACLTPKYFCKSCSKRPTSVSHMSRESYRNSSFLRNTRSRASASCLSISTSPLSNLGQWLFFRTGVPPLIASFCRVIFSFLKMWKSTRWSLRANSHGDNSHENEQRRNQPLLAEFLFQDELGNKSDKKHAAFTQG